MMILLVATISPYFLTQMGQTETLNLNNNKKDKFEVCEMKIQKPSEVVAIKCQRHKLPIDVILFHMVDFRTIKALPINQDCTEILRTATQRALNRMFVDGEPFVETFMPRRKEFETLLIEEIKEYKNSQWQPLKKVILTSVQDNNSVVTF